MAKIVVGFDASVSEDVAAAAARLAQALEAELLGIFVEESAALRLAELPFGMLIEHSGRARALDLGHVEALLRVAAARARNELSRAARRERVPVAFEVRRGRLLRELFEAAAEEDLMVMGSARPEPRAPSARGPVTVVARDDRSLRRLLEVASAVAGPELLVLIAGGPARSCAEAWARDTGHPVLIRTDRGSSPRALARTVGQLSGRLLVVAGSEWSDHELGELRRELGCPLVVVR